MRVLFLLRRPIRHDLYSLHHVASGTQDRRTRDVGRSRLDYRIAELYLVREMRDKLRPSIGVVAVGAPFPPGCQRWILVVISPLCENGSQPTNSS